MKKIAHVIAIAVLVSACSWFQKNQAYFPTPDDLACVANEIERGISDPTTIIKNCPAVAQLALADLEALIAGLNLARSERLGGSSKDAGTK